MSSPSIAIAFFGSTGGSANACLSRAIENDFKCSALVRSKDKLMKMLQERNVSEAKITSNLKIIQGDVRNENDVKNTLLYDEDLAEVIVSGVGANIEPKDMLHWKPPMPDKTITQDTAITIMKVLHSIQSENKTSKKPHFVSVSASGIDGMYDVPLLVRPFFLWLLQEPYADKRVMEQTIRSEASDEEGKGAISGYTILRPSFFTDGESKPLEEIRVGDDQEPAVGYSISRDAVGLWIFERRIKSYPIETSGIVTITY